MDGSNEHRTFIQKTHVHVLSESENRNVESRNGTNVM